MDRYDRQRRVHTIGDKGQAKINHSTVLIVGMGALGTYAAAQLVRAGIGKLILVDPDIVTLTNLQRQALFTEEDASSSTLKVEAAKQRLLQINSQVEIIAIPAPLSADLIDECSFDLCLDCLDNYSARDLLNRLAIKNHFDYVFASCAGNYGNVMVISPANHPCLNCLFPNINELKQNDCDIIGVNTALIPLVAGMQVSQALHYLVAEDSVDFDQLLTVNNWSMSSARFKINKNPHCPTCQRPSAITVDEQKTELHMLCGEGAFYTNLKQPILDKWRSHLNRDGKLLGSSPLFIHFSWRGRPVSLFKNGKLIMYQLEDSKEATTQLVSLKQFAEQITGDDNE